MKTNKKNRPDFNPIQLDLNEFQNFIRDYTFTEEDKIFEDEKAIPLMRKSHRRRVLKEKIGLIEFITILFFLVPKTVFSKGKVMVEQILTHSKIFINGKVAKFSIKFIIELGCATFITTASMYYFSDFIMNQSIFNPNVSISYVESIHDGHFNEIWDSQSALPKQSILFSNSKVHSNDFYSFEYAGAELVIPQVLYSGYDPIIFGFDNKRICGIEDYYCYVDTFADKWAYGSRTLTKGISIAMPDNSNILSNANVKNAGQSINLVRFDPMTLHHYTREDIVGLGVGTFNDGTGASLSHLLSFEINDQQLFQGDINNFRLDYTHTPEPGTFLLLGSGILGLGLFGWFRRRKA